MVIHSPEFLKKRRQRRKRLFGIGVGLMVVLLALAIYISHRPSFLLAEVRVEGNTVTSSEEVESRVQELLAGKYLLLFPRANVLLYPRGGIRHKLTREIPRLSNVELRVADSRVLEVYVNERTPYALYCEDIGDMSLPEGCYFLDANGFIFSKAPAFSGSVYYLYYRDALVSEPLGEDFLPPERFREVSLFIDRLRALGVESRAFVYLVERGEYYFILENMGRILLNADQELGKALLDLRAFLASEAVGGEGDFIDNVEQIDLSIENRVRWRMQQEEAQETQAN